MLYSCFSPKSAAVQVETLQAKILDLQPGRLQPGWIWQLELSDLQIIELLDTPAVEQIPTRLPVYYPNDCFRTALWWHSMNSQLLPYTGVILDDNKIWRLHSWIQLDGIICDYLKPLIYIGRPTEPLSEVQPRQCVSNCDHQWTFIQQVLDKLDEIDTDAEILTEELVAACQISHLASERLDILWQKINNTKIIEYLKTKDQFLSLVQ